MPRVSSMTNNSSSAKLEGFGDELTHRLPLRDQCLCNYSMNTQDQVSYRPTWKPKVIVGNDSPHFWSFSPLIMGVHCII